MGLAQRLPPEIEQIEAEYDDSVKLHMGGREWIVAGTRAAGAVRLDGEDGFSARFCGLADYDFDACSQEMAVHDAAQERMFFDFTWSGREPSPDLLKQLTDRMQRAVQSVVSRR